MPILDLQIGLREVGRIRCGDQVTAGKGRAPRKLDRFRFTADDEQLLAVIADLYGGTVGKWEGAPVGDQWEVYTTAERIPIMIVPGLKPFSQWYEAWSGGGCQRRCDGRREMNTSQPCICNTSGERVCKPTTRLSVVLPEIRGLGTWRLESHGYYAAVELGGTIELIGKAVAATREVVYGTLRLTQRVQKVGGQTRRFAVPTLDINVTMPELAEWVEGEAITTRTRGNRTLHAAPETAPETAPAGPVPALAARLDDGRSPWPTPEEMAAADERAARKVDRKRTPPMGPGKRADARADDVDERGRWKWRGTDPADAAREGPTTPEDRPEAVEWRDPPPEPPEEGDVAAAFASPASDAQRKAMFAGFRDLAMTDRDERLMFAARIIGRSINTSTDLTASEASAVLNTLDAVRSGEAELTTDDTGRITGARWLDPPDQGDP